MNEHEKINYIEYPATDIEKTKDFFEQAFSWEFTDYGPDYCAFNKQGIEGGFYKSRLVSCADKGPP